MFSSNVSWHHRPATVSLCVGHHPRLDDEAPSWGKVTLSVTEDIELRGEAPRVEDPVERKYNYREGRITGAGITVVTYEDVNLFPAGLASELRNHPLGAVDTCHPHAHSVQRQSKAPGADSELEHRAFWPLHGQVRETRYSGVGVTIDSRIKRVVIVTDGLTVPGRFRAGQRALPRPHESLRCGKSCLTTFSRRRVSVKILSCSCPICNVRGATEWSHPRKLSMELRKTR